MKIKNIATKIKCAALITLCAACVLPFAACGEEQPVKYGIEITAPSAPVYTQESVGRISDGIYALIYKVMQRQTGIVNLPQATEQRLRGYAEGATQAITSVQMSADDLNRLAGLLNSEDALSAAEELSGQAVLSLYGDISSAVGFVNAGALCYRLALYYYDLSYFMTMDRYNSYGGANLLEEAQSLAKEKADMQNLVGQENFATVLRTVCALGSLARDGLNEGAANLLTDGEILSLIKAQPFDQIDIGDGGRLTLLSFACRICAGSCAGDLLECTFENGDAPALAEGLDGLLQLLCGAQQRMTAAQAALLRADDADSFISSVFAQFGADDWQLFEEITPVTLSDRYDEIMAKRFGTDYEKYRGSIETHTLSELERAAGGDNFMQVLEGYVAGFAPCIAFLAFA